MTLYSTNTWEIAVAAVLVAALLGVGLWLVFRRRPTADELEQKRRLFLSRSGRLVDGMLLDVLEIEAAGLGKDAPPRMLTLLAYSYRIGGVDYESSQDITAMCAVLDASQVRVGFPCSARYQPGNPQNSIVVSEEWSGLREGLPVFSAYEDPDPLDRSYLNPEAVAEAELPLFPSEHTIHLVEAPGKKTAKGRKKRRG